MKLQDVKKSLREDKRILFTGAALLALAAVLFLCLLKIDRLWEIGRTVSGALAPVLCGIIIAYVLNVFVHFFEDLVFYPLRNSQSKVWRKVRRPLAVLLAYLVVFLVIAFVALFIIPGLLESTGVLTETLRQTVPGFVESATKWITAFAQEYDLTLVQDFLKGFNWSSLLSDATKMASDFLSSLVSATFNVANGLFVFVMGFIFSIYMLFGKEKLLRGVRSSLLAYLPEGAAQKTGEIASMANRVFSSFIRGQLTECVILGSLCYIGMNILRLDYSLLISSVVAFGALIPILGAYIACITGVVILLLVHPIDALIFLVFLLCLQQVEGNLIYPRVVGSSIGLPPVWTLFAVLFWGGVLGIPGILIGTPATAVLYRLFRASVRGRLQKKGIDPGGPMPISPENTSGPDEPEADAPAELPDVDNVPESPKAPDNPEPEEEPEPKGSPESERSSQAEGTPMA